MTKPATELPFSGPVTSVRIRGGDGAPARARRHVVSYFDGEASGLPATDAVLLVSELVTNSVLHAKVRNDQALVLELTTLADHLRIVVTDPGSHLEPRIVPADPTTPGGFGLRLVDHMCSAWGVARDAGGTTRVWCDLPLDHAPS